MAHRLGAISARTGGAGDAHLLGQRAREVALSLAGVARRAMPQPLLGLAMASLALCSLSIAWAMRVPPVPGAALDPAAVALAVALAGATVVAQLYPVHVARGFKLQVITIPLYLLAVLTPPALAATSAGIAILIGELAQRRRKGSLPSDVATSAGRLALVVLISSLVGHTAPPIVPAVALGGQVALPLGAPLTRLPLLLAAAALYLGDVLSGTLEVSAITGEAPHRTLLLVVREVSAGEALQYVVGLVGALAARADAWSIALLLVPALLVRHLLRQRLEVHDETRALLESLADTVDLRDPYTGSHSRRVAAHTAAILAALGMRGPEVDLITLAARVHDIGKIALPDRLLSKEGDLTEDEWAEVRSHPQRGAEFLERYPDFRRGVAMVLHHHERVNGMGYPHGLRGDDIPFGARVIAVADSYDAMVTDRPYRKGKSIGAAAGVLLAGRGTQWDPAIVDAFASQVVPVLLREAASTCTRGAPALALR